MLGRLKKTSRVDVGLAVAFAGVSYLVWSLVAGMSRKLMLEMMSNFGGNQHLTQVTQMVKMFFVDFGVAIDVVGLTWLLGSMILIMLGSRQKISISWAWVCAITQSFAAAMGGVLVAVALRAPYQVMQDHYPLSIEISMISLPISITLAILLWVTFLIWLLVERSRLSRRNPTLSDGLRTNVYR